MTQPSLFDLPRTVVADLAPAADDGARFWRDVLAFADRMGRVAPVPLHPSTIRIAAELEGIRPPREVEEAGNPWWGSLASKLLRLKWEPRSLRQRNPIASRNGAAEHTAYLHPVWSAS